MLVAEGDEVHTGDPLLVIDPTETRKELADAQKELTEAERGVSDAQLEVSKAQSDLSAAQRKLSRLHITAPFTGKLIPAKDSDDKDVSFRVGEQVSEGQVIGYMVNDRQMKLTLAFSAEYARSIRTGQSATVSIASAMSEVSGTVSSVETAQQISSEGVRVIRVGITVNNPGSLTKGMTATATINTGRLGAIYPANAGTLEYSREEAVTAQMSGEIIKLNGSIELAPIVGLSEVIVDIVETGSTLKENGLKVLEEVCPLSARMIVNQVSMKMEDERIRKLIRELRDVISQ